MEDKFLGLIVFKSVVLFLRKGGNAEEAIRIINQKIIETDNEQAKAFLEEAKRLLDGGIDVESI